MRFKTSCATDLFPISELQNPSIDVSEIHKVGLSSGFSGSRTVKRSVGRCKHGFGVVKKIGALRTRCWNNLIRLTLNPPRVMWPHNIWLLLFSREKKMSSSSFLTLKSRGVMRIRRGGTHHAFYLPFCPRKMFHLRCYNKNSVVIFSRNNGWCAEIKREKTAVKNGAIISSSSSSSSTASPTWLVLSLLFAWWRDEGILSQRELLIPMSYRERKNKKCGRNVGCRQLIRMLFLSLTNSATAEINFSQQQTDRHADFFYLARKPFPHTKNEIENSVKVIKRSFFKLENLNFLISR